MSCVVELLCARVRPPAIALTMIGLGLAGCSSESDSLQRQSHARWSPRCHGLRDACAHGPGREQPVAAARRPMAAPVAACTHAASAVRTAAGIAGGGRGMASYTPGSASSPGEVTGSLPAPPPARKPPDQWSWDGGTAVTVAPGETVEGIARRHGVPAAAVISRQQSCAECRDLPGSAPGDPASTPGRRDARPAGSACRHHGLGQVRCTGSACRSRETDRRCIRRRPAFRRPRLLLRRRHTASTSSRLAIP